MPIVFYTLPKLRFINVIRLILFTDAIVSSILWLTGGHDQYLENNVSHWTLTGSVFELAILALVKMLLFGYLFYKLESITMQQTEDPYNQSLKKSKLCLHLILIFLSLSSLSYVTTKGILVLIAYKGSPGKDYTPMHNTYNALTISAIIFSLLEFLMAVTCSLFLRKLKIIRIKHRFNDDGIEEDEDGKPIEKKVDLLRMIALAKPESLLIFLGLLGLLASSGSTMAAPLFFGKVVDVAIHSENMEKVNQQAVILLIVFSVGAVGAFVRSWMFTLAGYRVVTRIRKMLFAAIIRQEVAFFDQNRTGELTNRLSSDTAVLQNAITVNISMLVRYSFQIIGSLVIMFIQSPQLTGVLISVVPIIAIGAVQYGKFVRDLRKKFQDELAEAGTTAEENISSIRTVRTFVGEDKANKEYSYNVEKSYKSGSKIALASGIFGGGIGIIAQGAIVLVLWYGGKLVYENSHGHGGISIGVLTSFMLYTLNVAMAFAFLSSLYGDFMQALGASFRIFGLMDRVPLVRNEGGDTMASFKGGIAFKNVSFTYPSRPDTQVLKDITFNVEPGSVVALVGPSGGGKSTIVNLIEKFYEVDSGVIMLNNGELNKLDPRWFRQKVSMVSQEPVLFACSIRDNIAYGREASQQEIEDVSKQANAHQFISSFEDGYDTMVGERGVRLSGGQKQRVAIARALLMNPSILLLDEATSALDAESEHLVQEAIDRAMEGRTVLVIAHRLSTVRNASQVIVINQGQVAEKGTHEELLAKNGVYKKLVLRQLEAGSTTSSNMLSINTNSDEFQNSTDY